ncbi:MAG: MFS transporter [Anaerolineae bacterium]|nr:MFS transporter [Anaerolineae bacterium]
MDITKATLLLNRIATQRRSKVLQTISYYGIFVIEGLVLASLGPTLDNLAQQTSSTTGQVGILFTMRSIGGLLGALIGGQLYDKNPGHPLMLTMLAITIAALFFIPLTPVLWLLCLLMLILGFAQNTLDVGSNTLLAWIHGERVAPYLNGLHFFFGVGALIAPIIVAQALKMTGEIRWAYWILGMAVLLVIAWLKPVPSPIKSALGQDIETKPTNKPLVNLFTLFFFIYVGAEICFGGWIYNYAQSMGLANTTTAAYLTSGFFGAFTLGRLLSIPIAARFKPGRVLSYNLAGSLLSLGIIILGPASSTLLWIGTLGLGLSMASIFPGVYSMAERHIAITGKITGVFFIGGNLGAMSIPWIVGQLLENANPQAMMTFLMGNVAVAAIVFIILNRYLQNMSKQPI